MVFKRWVYSQFEGHERVHLFLSYIIEFSLEEILLVCAIAYYVYDFFTSSKWMKKFYETFLPCRRTFEGKKEPKRMYKLNADDLISDAELGDLTIC